MPKRVRAQRIEERSRAAFKAALDERFLFRDDTPDFGIDGSVEEFDDRDRATGLRYFVQLKATDGDDLHEASEALDSNRARESLQLSHAADSDGPLHSRPRRTLRALVAFSAAGPAPRPRADAASLTFQWGPEDKFGEGGCGSLRRRGTHLLGDALRGSAASALSCVED